MNPMEKVPVYIIEKCCPIWPYIESIIEFLIETRKSIKKGDVHAGINYSIILNTACCVEGLLEYILKEILFQKRSTRQGDDSDDFNNFYFLLEKEIHDRIAKTTGIDSYNYLFKLLTGKEFKKIDAIKRHIEGINILFEFRNVLAHGREIKFESFYIDINNKEHFDSFVSGYKKAEDYLIKNRIIKQRFTDCKHDIFFSNKVADHFYKLSHSFINDVIKSLDIELQKLFS